jgi:hypothetical protein
MNDSIDRPPTTSTTSAEATSSTIPDAPDGAAFSRTIRTPRLWRVGVVAACGVALLVSAALSLAASPAPSPATPSTGSSADGQSGGGPWFGLPGVVGPGPGLAGPGIHDFGGRLHLGRFGGVTISAINGSSLSLKTDDGWTRAIAISDSTKITKGGQTISASDLKVGDTIGFSESRQDDGSYTIDAIVVLVPHVAGTVTDVTANGFTLKAHDGTTWTITVTGSTTYTVGGKDGSKADVKADDEVVVAGNKGSADSSLTALSVNVRLPTVVGEVTAKAGNTITIKRPDGTTQTVHVGAGTTYRIAGVGNPSLADVKVGMTVIAQGTQRSDGSLDATAVGAGVGRGFRTFGNGFGPFGFFGPHGTGGQTPSPSTSPGGSGTGTQS